MEITLAERSKYRVDGDKLLGNLQLYKTFINQYKWSSTITNTQIINDVFAN